MTIRNPKKFVESLWDWGFLDNCFGQTKIKVTDIDGIVERNGHFLVIEGKDEGVPIPYGQKRMFEVMHKTNLFTIIQVWGPANNPTHYKLMIPGIEYKKVPCELKDIQRVVNQWFEFANRTNVEVSVFKK
jgi:hypothetical protein